MTCRNFFFVGCVTVFGVAQGYPEEHSQPASEHKNNHPAEDVESDLTGLGIVLFLK